MCRYHNSFSLRRVAFALPQKLPKRHKGLCPLDPYHVRKASASLFSLLVGRICLMPRSANSVLFQIHSHIYIPISSSFHTTYRQHTRHAHWILFTAFLHDSLVKLRRQSANTVALFTSLRNCCNLNKTLKLGNNATKVGTYQTKFSATVIQKSVHILRGRVGYAVGNL